MTEMFGIEFAPLNIPLKRRLQTFAVALRCFDFMLLGLLSTLLMIFLLFTRFYLVPLLYLSWIIYDKDTVTKGSRLRMWYRRLRIWRYFADYFPVTLHKTVDLDPKENYIFGFHPHGIIPCSVFATICTDGAGFSKIFPGITARPVTLNLNFWMPLHREHLMFLGACSANKESVEWIINENGKGNAAVIVVGGADESLDAVSDKMELKLNNRKGFVKLALKHGVSLVPVISFGENELFSQREFNEASLVRQIQRRLKRTLHFALPVFHGRGVLQYTFGFLPYRKPINTIVGKPIKVPQTENPLNENINQYRALYVESLKELFYANRKQFASDPNMKIVIK